MYSGPSCPDRRVRASIRVIFASIIGAFAPAALLPAASAQLLEDALPVVEHGAILHPELARDGMVAAQHELSAETGAEILAAGGNAVDAAVAVGFSLAVTLPRAGNLGGGGFMLVHDAQTGETIGIDYREVAPAAATRDMFLNERGDVDPNLARYSHLSAGVPGTVAGLWLAHQRYGSLSWKRVLEPAIRQARDGIVVTFDEAQMLAGRKNLFCRFEAACGYFFKAGNGFYEPGDRLVQSDLAATLERIARKGPDGFYRGRTAELIAAEMRANGGLIDMDDLAGYEVVVREPLVGEYRGYRIVTMPPPSSGGVHLLQMLNVLEHFDVADMGFGSADALHLLAETARLAYADRSRHLGDPQFHPVPVGWLTGKTYAAKLAGGIDMRRARASSDVAPGEPPAKESVDTTHYSVIDRDGNVVSNTYTLNLSFGSGIAVSGAGFLLNNEMDDFVSKPGVPNAYGLLGGDANAIEPGKRPLSSMTPTIVFADGEPWFATGSPGGSTIITAVLQIVVNVIDHGLNLAEAGGRPRMHHQWLPDQLTLEQGFSPDSIAILKERGHDVRISPFAMGSVQSVGMRRGIFIGASDPRRPDAAAVAPAAAER